VASGVIDMRRVVMEVPEQQIKKLGAYTAELSRDVESLKVVHHLKHGTGGSAIICKIKPKEGGTKIGDLRFRFKRFEVLSEEEDGFLVYLEAETAPLSPGGPNPPRVYLNFPFEVRGGNRRVTFLGEATELKRMFQWLEARGVKFQVLSNSDARSSPESFLDGLSRHQREALLSAYANGYYEVPRRVNLDELARLQNVNKSTFAEHLLKAENRLISRILADELNHMQPDEV
jgi:hypothetical protein